MRSVKNLFKYRRTSVSILTFLLYVSVGIYFYLFNEGVPAINYDNEDVYLLDNAWLHLQQITKHPHPYCSKENDNVHDYLYSEIKKLVHSKSSGPKDKYDFVEIQDDKQDLQLKALFKQKDVFNAKSKDTRVIYYESSNIMVKVEGKLGNSVPGVLLSAHYDSVPLGNGATDDGKGIVTLFAMLEYFLENQPEKTLVFNFNNNEEFGLLGATIFGTDHPWRSLVDSVINLEGTGTGGSRAVLFRTSDTKMAKLYQEAVQDQPFGNSMYQQGFYNRFVGSETDYKVYQEQQGLRGWDIAFIKPRDLYHTWKDSTQFTDKESLYHMLHTTYQLSTYVANNVENSTGAGAGDGDFEINGEDDLSPAVYFDFAGSFYVLSSKKLFEINIISLISFPILTIITFLIVNQNIITEKKKAYWTFFKLPISMVISYLVLLSWNNCLQNVNPLIVSRNYWFPIASSTSIYMLSQYYILRGVLKAGYKFKTISMLEITIGLWFYLLKATINLKNHDYKDTGIYGFTILYILFSIGSIVGILLEPYPSLLSTTDGIEFEDSENGQLRHTQPLINSQVNYGSIDNNTHPLDYENSDDEQDEQDEQDEEEQDDDNDDHEITSDSLDKNQYSRAKKNHSYYNWLLQYMVVFPGSLYIMFNCGGLIIDALNQTVQESEKATFNLFRFIPLMAIFISLPLLPFITRLNYLMVMLINGIFIVSSLVCVFGKPFTDSIPMKIRTGEYWDLNTTPPTVKIHTYGRDIGDGFLENIIRDLPSQKYNKNFKYDCVKAYDGNVLCKHDAIPLAPGTNSSLVASPYEFDIEVIENNRLDSKRSKYEPISATFEINVKENRACTLKFPPSTENTLREITINGDEKNLHYIKAEGKGIDELQLHKLDFTKSSYKVNLVWLPQILLQNSNSNTRDELEVEVSCYWGDYATFDEKTDNVKINSPGLMELIDYSPKNVIYTNREKGMIVSQKKVVF